MAVVLLPPGNKIKILAATEIIEVAEVLKKKESNWEKEFQKLEKKWSEGPYVFDIDLISLTATPLSEYENHNVALQYAEQLQKARTERKKPSKKRRIPQNTKAVPKKPRTTQQEPQQQQQQDERKRELCGQGQEEWDKLFLELDV